jgi:hypothetical protein
MPERLIMASEAVIPIPQALDAQGRNATKFYKQIQNTSDKLESEIINNRGNAIAQHGYHQLYGLKVSTTIEH